MLKQLPIAVFQIHPFVVFIDNQPRLVVGWLVADFWIK